MKNDVRHLQAQAEEYRRVGRTTDDLWESVICLNLAARCDELAAHYAARSKPAGERSREAAARERLAG